MITITWIGGLNTPARTSIFIGARGCGKTALLTYFAIESGIIESAGRGKVVTTLPGLKEYLENSY